MKKQLVALVSLSFVLMGLSSGDVSTKVAEDSKLLAKNGIVLLVAEKQRSKVLFDKLPKLGKGESAVALGSDGMLHDLTGNATIVAEPHWWGTPAARLDLKAKGVKEVPLVAVGKSPKNHLQWSVPKAYDGALPADCTTYEKGFGKGKADALTIEGTEEVFVLASWEKEKKDGGCGITYVRGLLGLDRKSGKCRRLFLAKKDCDGQGLSSISKVHGLLVVDKAEKYLIVDTQGYESHGPAALSYPVPKELKHVTGYELFGS
jgi:hypothetical protein